VDGEEPPRLVALAKSEERLDLVGQKPKERRVMRSDGGDACDERLEVLDRGGRVAEAELDKAEGVLRGDNRRPQRAEQVGACVLELSNRVVSVFPCGVDVIGVRIDECGHSESGDRGDI
jgi:hypothetical protein